ncbi:MAG TPA: PD-(D/E)XK nuclease family protein, partial [Acidimicrobiia bacterium]|nr:PD-(D/E)XK nuclease family protein [Acidimicrobiia bacterium]
LEAGRFERELDRSWRRTSYTGIVSAAHDARVASEPEAEGTVDEPEVTGAAAEGARLPPRTDDLFAERQLRERLSLWQELGGGADVGTFVHRILERVDFTTTDLAAALGAEVALAANRRPPALTDDAAVVAALQAAIETPLGSMTGGRALRDFGSRHRLNELHFELPLAGGDDPTASVSIAAVAALLREHLPADDPLAGYADRLDDPALADTLRGYLSGSLDLVLRIPGAAGGRFAVIDHKTNWLGSGEEPLSAWHYRPAAMAEAMQRAHYPLQALLYTVALHRYLRWRLRGYDPDEHLAGVMYLFLRGMSGADTPTVNGQPCGVFAWRPPTGLVLALSDVLDGRRPTEEGRAA